MTLIAGTRLGPYEIVAPLGAGGMGEVYRARDTRLGRDVAVKVLAGALADAARLSRFDQEARAIAALSHPNILAIFDVGDGEPPFLVTELLDGETLRARLDRGPMPVATAVAMATQLLAGLAAAHDRGIVHRDVKPDNVFLTRDGVVKILDFGLAKTTSPVAGWATDVDATRAGATIDGTILGTVGYMAPEQVRGTTVDHRGDIFAVGALIYEMVTGRRAFHGESPADTMSAILREQPDQLAVAGAMPPAVSRIIRRCVEKAPQDRFQSARDLCFALESVADQRPAAVSKTPDDASIAVLPFTNMSADAENEYFCDGIAEDLIGALTKIEQLRVAARTSAFSFKGKHAALKDVGRTLNVRTVLEGSVRKAGNRLRVTAQLVNVADGYQLWSERYDRQLEDVFAIQDEISLAIVNALRVRLLGGQKAVLAKRYTDNVQAYELYLKGRHHWHAWNADGLGRSRECMERAIALDPDYALAYTGLADCALASGSIGLISYAELLPGAKAHLTRAVSLDPELDEAWTLLSIVHFFEWDWPAAARTVARAIELNPRLGHAHQALGCIRLWEGRYDEALASLARAVELEPLAPAWNVFLVLVQMARGDRARAWDRVRVGLEFDPGFWMTHWARSMLLMSEGDRPQAVRAAEEAVRCSSGAPSAVGLMICALGLAGQRERAEQELAALVERAGRGHVPALSMALAHAGLGETDRAFEWLEKSYVERDVWLRGVGWNPMFAGLREDPRLNDLLRRMGLDRWPVTPTPPS